MGRPGEQWAETKNKCSGSDLTCAAGVERPGMVKEASDHTWH